jgi:sulfur relay (sulfurtransferase) DsrC/TusE family protein
MSYKNLAETYIQPQYTSLNPIYKDTSTNFSQELLILLSKNPEFTSTKAHLDILRYCYDHYINCDPISRDLPLQEKFKQAGEMAKNFISIVFGANV